MLNIPLSIEITPDNRVIVLDQTKLPNIKDFIEIKTCKQMADAILRLVVRGAPLIGCSAACGLYLAAKENVDNENLKDILNKSYKLLSSTRPTAVNLVWALNQCMSDISGISDNVEIVNTLLYSAKRIISEDTELCKKIGENGLTLFSDNDTIITHCNAGSLATSYYGTALSPLYVGKEKGYNFTVYADETRPLLQGSRITAFELMESGIDTFVISDSMAGWVMKTKGVDKVIVGADRIASNGDSANKIGSYSLSILAKHHKIPFYVAAPYSTIDLTIKNGDEIIIEERDSMELKKFRGCQSAPEGVKAFNPAFDIIPAENITAIITDKGVIYPPFSGKLG